MSACNDCFSMLFHWQSATDSSFSIREAESFVGTRELKLLVGEYESKMKKQACCSRYTNVSIRSIRADEAGEGLCKGFGMRGRDFICARELRLSY